MKFYRLSRCVYVLINFSYWDQLQEWDCTQKSQEKLIKGRAMKSNLGVSTQGKVLKGICSTGPAQLVCLLTSSFLNVNLRALLLLLPVLWQRKNAPHKTTFLFPYSLGQLNGAEPKLPLPNTQTIHFSHRAEPWEQDLGCWLLCSSPSLCRADSAAGWAQQSHPEQLQFPQQENAASLGHSRLCSRFSLSLCPSPCLELQGIHPALCSQGTAGSMDWPEHSYCFAFVLIDSLPRARSWLFKQGSCGGLLLTSS